MSEEEYLKAAGWEEPAFEDSGWTCERFLNERGTMRGFTTAEAVEAQLAEDRARYNFVRERSAMGGGLLVPIPDKSDDCRTERKP